MDINIWTPINLSISYLVLLIISLVFSTLYKFVWSTNCSVISLLQKFQWCPFATFSGCWLNESLSSKFDMAALFSSSSKLTSFLLYLLNLYHYKMKYSIFFANFKHLYVQVVIGKQILNVYIYDIRWNIGEVCSSP